ncbi:type I restriction-modification system subunit M [Geotalea uraniireducens]|uniref:site-specific DNA-methyltransferase (adenine-specific) n=1 Tax=Geotalea uraniireducens (strain Rf4) TaxID=351605 RepID=A5G3B7_GEOUR|nr:class I SAM-dependent DNA methyltransferase [Geotalea uraniireducens]ABQ26285.1 N-6 DNA methylase [Geotalea uraniireducens Rf4]
MLTGENKAKIDKIWDAFWTGGISDSLRVIEQMSYLLFIKRLDDLHTAKEKKANRLGKPIEEPIFGPKQDHLRWSRFREFEAGEMFRVVSQEVFPFIKNLHGNEESAYARHMKDAIFMIPTPSLLERVVEQISQVPMEDRDTKGDLYEYMLSKLTTAGRNGQFRTPRHIIKMMVELMQPRPDDIICDPACGTAGFLVAAGEYLREHHGDLFHNEKLKKHFNEKLFNGFDFDSTMLRIASMNMMLHGVENPAIEARDSLSSAADIADAYTLILANPPFKGSLDEDTVAKDLLRTVKTKKTELLFIALMLRLLKPGGRCAVIVPDGVLFGSSKAHLDLRKILVDGHKLEAMISMPSGVFRPYAGVSTGILIFTKTNSGGTDHVWFYDMQADGFSLDDKRNPVEQNDIPDVVESWLRLRSATGLLSTAGQVEGGTLSGVEAGRTAKSFLVSVQEIRDNKYDLSINRYKKVEHEEVAYEPPQVIIARLEALEREIAGELAELALRLRSGND